MALMASTKSTHQPLVPLSLLQQQWNRLKNSPAAHTIGLSTAFQYSKCGGQLVFR